MGVVNFLLLLVNVVSALAIVGLVLVQHGKGADAGATFGSGSSASGSLFGATGSANFLSRTTSAFAAVWFASCVAMVALGSHHSTAAPSGVMSALGKSASSVSAKTLPGKPAASHVVPE